MWLASLFQNQTVFKELFKDVFIPSAADWAELRDKVQADGLYHQNRLAVAPNGSISYINDVSASIHPITQRIEERQEKKIGKNLLSCCWLVNRNHSLLHFCLRYGYA